MVLSEMGINQVGVVNKIEDVNLLHHLTDMGCVPGQEITVMYKAPFGGPIAISILGYLLMVRKEDAHKIHLTVN